MKGNDHVKTAIRWRPVTLPVTDGRDVAIEKVNDNIISVSSMFMNYDNVFDSSDQSEVFDVLVKPLIDKAIEGFDFTFLATGQTGSGKTYTMGFERSVDSDNNGIVPRVLSSLFCHENANRFKIQISFVEVYKDQAFDLLSTNPQEPFFTKNPKHRTTEATKKTVQNETEVMTMISNGTMKRHVRGTKMNSVSSRSHAIFTIYLCIEHQKKVRESVINLVDLAGSEGYRNTGNIGEAQTEGKSINEGLSAFKRVINSMVHGDNHIPFRDAVITRLLERSLNPRSYLTLLGCVSPYQDDYGETLNTLRFVSEAKQIKISPQMNAAINEYKKSKTPNKTMNASRISQTPNSMKRMIQTPFKMPWSNHSQKKLSFSSRLFGEPPAKKIMSSNFNSSASRPRYCASVMNSTSKKSSTVRPNRTDRSSIGGQANKSKAVANLFAAKTINETTFMNETIEVNWANASTSSVIQSEPIQLPLPMKDPTPNVQPSPQSMERVLKTCLIQQKELALLNSPMRDIIIRVVSNVAELKRNDIKEENVNDIKPQSQVHPLPPSPPLSHQTPSELTAAIEEPAKTPMKNRLNSCPENPNVANVSIGNDVPQANTIDAPMDVDPIEKILVCTTTNHVPITLPSLSIDKQSVDEHIESTSKKMTILEAIEEVSTKDTFEAPLEKTTNDILVYDLVSQAVCDPKMPDTTVENFTENSICDNAVPVNKYENVAEFVSPLKIRKIEKPPHFDVTSMYEIVKKDQNLQPQPMIENCLKYSYPEVEYSFPEQQSFEEQNTIEKTPKVNRPTSAFNRFPFSPRIILQRIENIREYQISLKRGSSHVGSPDKKNRKSKRAKVTQIISTRQKPRAKPATSTKTIINKKVSNVHKSLQESILNIINTGTVKDLQKLPTIGQKKAGQIFTYREIHGQFKNIDAMKKMPFWPDKTHERFLVNNNIV